MEKQAVRGLEGLVNPLTYNLADAIANPGKPKRTKKSKRKDRQATSSESSAEKPPKSKPRMSAVNGQVSAAVMSINNSTAASNETMDVRGQSTSGRNDPPGRQSGRAGNKGDQFCREFCKMDPVKKECRDNKDERSYRRDNVPCHYDALTDNKFVATTRTIESMLPTLTPTEVVGVIMAHYHYKESFLEAVTVDLGSFCRTKTDIQSIEDAFMEDEHKVEDLFPEVWKCFFTDPFQKTRSITCFKNNLVTEEYLSDHQRMASGLKHILNSILIKTKITFQNLKEEEKDWSVAMRKSYHNALSVAVTPDIV